MARLAPRRSHGRRVRVLARPISLLLVLLACTSVAGCASAYDRPPGDPRPVLTAEFGSDYSGSEVGRFRPQGRFAVQLSCPAGDATVTLTAGDKAVVELEMSCTTNQREEFALAVDRKVEVTLTARSENAERQAALFRIG